MNAVGIRGGNPSPIEALIASHLVGMALRAFELQVIWLGPFDLVHVSFEVNQHHR